ncbi:hypothetical protein FXO37_30499 [Capsicum annuum]|nr:hypothetical protein FXO37_30499 [Capsicum annuum]
MEDEGPLLRTLFAPSSTTKMGDILASLLFKARTNRSSSLQRVWGNIAHKISRFIYVPEVTQQPQLAPGLLEGSFKEACTTNRWSTEASRKAQMQVDRNIINIIGDALTSTKDLLSRCLVAGFQSMAHELPHLNEVRSWACNMWKTGGGVDVFAMNDGIFLFDLPSKKIVEHVLNGTWFWKKNKLVLEWWNPTTGCWPTEITRDWVWIRILGLPLSMWSQKIFKQTGDQCGGFTETEEETSLRTTCTGLA